MCIGMQIHWQLYYVNDFSKTKCEILIPLYICIYKYVISHFGTAIEDCTIA